MHTTTETLKQNIRAALLDQRLQAAVLKATDHSLAKRAEVVAELPAWEALRSEAALRRDRTLARLDQALLELEKKASEKGIQVHWAADGEEANRIISEICRKIVSSVVSTTSTSNEHPNLFGCGEEARGETPRPLIAKSKSMTTEEIGLTHFLEGQGYEVVETDLGEYIVQIAGQTPSHITAPALHLSRQDVGRIFVEKLGVEYCEDPVELINVARKVLREKFLAAQVGITGCNFAVAETGTPLIVENEGNGRLVSAIPPVQIIVMGLEKVVATLDDLMILLELLPRSATGQRITGSVIFFNRPSAGDETDGPRELHLVILDNGRSRALADPKLRAVLRCIRCGACLNACPVYRLTGGHAYGWTYPGPIGAVLGPVFLGHEKARDLPFASTLCGRCAEICPVKIDLHHMLLYLRQQIVASLPVSAGEKALWQSWEAVMDRPDLYHALASLPRFLLHDLLRGQWSPGLPVWGKDRSGPEMAKESFSAMFKKEFEK
jgi:L-lactate dehydrogenase complex protein LldF